MTARRRCQPAKSSRRERLGRAEKAVADLLHALGCELKGEVSQTPRRAAALWTDHLLAGEGVALEGILGRTSKTKSDAPITLFDVGVHLVCPHHLTVAFGRAHIGYLPKGRVAGFGALSRLIEACTARLVLQEDAANDIAVSLVRELDAVAAVACITAMHPCHNVPRGRSHRAKAVTWGRAGDAAGADALEKLLLSGASESEAPQR